ncbi:hypothetical protein [Tessaracoccus lapidicaptus]|uniref:hypothetical protein n=1 Tax=Tessaracoccus lapidicaptus TaxID=1427523 RepID=UPI00333F991A
MILGRRGLLAAALALAGCTPDPTILGAPAPVPVPPSPTQSPAARAAVAALAGLAWAIDAGRAPADAPEGYAGWADAAAAAVEAVTARLLAADPVAGGEPVFPAPTPAAPAASTAAEALAALAAASDAAVAALRTGALGALNQPLRLLYGSAACLARGLRAPGPAPVPGDAEPTHFQATTEQAALAVAVSHVWALLYGLGVGLGRLPASSEFEEYAVSRLASARELRNELRSRLSEPPLQPASFELPTPMESREEIREGWALLEAGLLSGLGRLAAAGGTDAAHHLDLLVAQGDAVTALGLPLPFWPGWA